MNRADCLDAAKQCVCTDRDKAYGRPEDNFALIAQYWSVYLGTEINAVQVANMMALMKIARITSGKFKADNYVDLAGYAACGCEIHAKITEEIQKGCEKDESYKELV